MADQVRQFLERKLDESQIKVKKLKQHKKIIKIIYVGTTVTSILISTVLASISALSIPPMVITVLAITSGFLTGISAKFNFHDKRIIINREIDQLNKIRSKLDYVTSCNGNLTAEKCEQIMKDFNL